MSDLYEELQALVGKEGPSVIGVDKVCKQMIRHWSEAMENANPMYTDEEYARKSKYGSIIAPPMMVLAFAQFPLWPDGQDMLYRHPEKLHGKKTLAPYEVAMQKLDEVGFTGMFVVGCAQEFIQPLFPGDQVIKTSKLLSVTEEKKTSAGNGHFLSVLFSYSNQKGELICNETYNILRFKPR
jgi:acyl dehydratase